MGTIKQFRDIEIPTDLFVTYPTGTPLDSMLSCYHGIPKGVNYMVIGDPGCGKSTVMLDLLCNLARETPTLRLLFISVEMNEVDLAPYMVRFPKFQYVDILFIEPDSGYDTFDTISMTLSDGSFDVVVLDSFVVAQGIIAEERGITMKRAGDRLLDIIKKNNKGGNSRNTLTSFLTIQQMTKSGEFLGSNRLKHAVTGVMELHLEDRRNVHSSRYITFSKHRRGEPGERLFYSLAQGGDVVFDGERLELDRKIQELQAEDRENIRSGADNFDTYFFTNDIDDQVNGNL